MVERISWFSPVDYEILGFFENHDIRSSPHIIALNIDYDRQYVSKRCRVLFQQGILTQHTDGVYELSDEGRAFIKGDVPPERFEQDVSESD
ncbi:phage repressor protein [Halorubrum vacuolatum]|uniref:Phage PhiH1 repressor protein n=1 Tax=Halorubrum vacuolatum TaxID=63740 RepID=A0A238WRM9_HALVU|nr:phage repressor protein [Halorubrum vacuolatum]SNR49137.1 hypothetical protein SAMN06264855_109116 [Halorubrum vacuolatum]